MFAPYLFLNALHVLVIGGGPNPVYNQVAIESNVRYIGKFIAPQEPFRVLFADGSLTTKSVHFTAEQPAAETKVGPFSVPGSRDAYREPQLPRLDGSATPDHVKSEIADLAKNPKSPAFIYFTGHGSLAPDLHVSQFDLWSGNRFTVPDLVDSLKAFDKNQPVTILMVQCHSSGFANTMYKDGDPGKGLADNRVCGFFASIAARVAAGCTPAVNEAYYKDFTSYFLAALTGQDRLGRPVTGADYNHDGKVGMNEAFCWSLVNDDSIDTPICTSDEFLKNAVVIPDADVFKISYKDALKWANPAQRAALDGLSQKLKLDGDDRLTKAFAKYGNLDPNNMNSEPILGFRFLSVTRSVVLAHNLNRHADRATRRRYSTLIKDEASNPLQP